MAGWVQVATFISRATPDGARCELATDSEEVNLPQVQRLVREALAQLADDVGEIATPLALIALSVVSRRGELTVAEITRMPRLPGREEHAVQPLNVLLDAALRHMDAL